MRAAGARPHEVERLGGPGLLARQVRAFGGPLALQHAGQPVDDDVEEAAHQQPEDAG